MKLIQTIKKVIFKSEESGEEYKFPNRSGCLTHEHPIFKRIKVYFDDRLIPDVYAIVHGSKGGWRYSQQEIEQTLENFEQQVK